MTPYHRPFAEQLAFFKAKLKLPSERWDDLRHEEHDRAFIVAGAQGADLLDDLFAAVARAIEDGTGLETFRKDFRTIVAKHGWTGWTGEGSRAGVAWRTKVIYQTNMATSYAAGRYQQLSDPDLLSVLPYWQYRHADGVRHPRPLHVAWNGLTLPPDHPFWQTHFPPNGWGCHCRVTAVPKSDYLRAIASGRGPADAPAAGDVSGIDAGFAYTPGRSVAAELRQIVDGKLTRLPAPIGADLAADAARLAQRRPLAAALDAEAERIAGAAIEHLILFDASGQQTLAKVGDAESVRLSAAELRLLPDAVLLHNHTGLPQSFSVDDVRLAVWHGLAEMHAVDRLFHYRLVRPPGETWGPETWQRLDPIWAEVESDVQQRLAAALSAGRIDPDQASVLLEHLIWTEVDARVRIGYSRRARSDP